MIRKAVSPDNIDRFESIIAHLLTPLGIDTIPEIMHYVTLLVNACDRYMFEVNHKSPQSKLNHERKKFIVVFKARYLQLTDMEYPRAITDIDCKMINNLVKQLGEKSLAIEEYLKWLFEDFLPKNDKFNPPTLRFACGNIASERYFYEYKDLSKERSKEETRQKEVLDLVERAKVIMRMPVGEQFREKVKMLLKNFKTASIMISEFRTGIERLEREAKEIAQKPGAT